MLLGYLEATMPQQARHTLKRRADYEQFYRKPLKRRTRIAELLEEISCSPQRGENSQRAMLSYSNRTGSRLPLTFQPAMVVDCRFRPFLP